MVYIGLTKHNLMAVAHLIRIHSSGHIISLLIQRTTGRRDFFHQGSIYIVAAASELPVDDPNRIRHWKLDRFKKAEVTDDYFKLPKDFDLEKHLGGSIGIFAAHKPMDFKIKISAIAANWVVEDPWHPEQSVELQNDGSIVLTVKAAHELEIIPRVLALGPEAEVLAPKSTREAIKARVQKMAEVYEKR